MATTVGQAPFLNYEVYQSDPAVGGAALWPYFSAGPQTTGSTTAASPGSYVTTVNIYGRILAQATPVSGAYADTLTVTVTY